jgi:hypothetical protein
MTKKQLGQFYTNKNIFRHPAFIEWFNNIPESQKETVLEPFAGKNGIVNMLLELKLINKFMSYDIVPGNEKVLYRDTILDFPTNYDVVITNPPFLARNSASRRQILTKIEPYNDLYEVCLQLSLQHSQYVAAIVPESFIVSPFFKNRVHTIISLAERHIFKDTEHPVCLVLFNPEENVDYKIYKNKKFIGSYNEIKTKIEKFFDSPSHNYILKYNDPIGSIGLIAIDATDSLKQICFIPGQEIPSEDVNGASRLRTRFTILNNKGRELSPIKIDKLIYLLNKNLKKYRLLSYDIELTAFKGMRTDNSYRRRLDFGTARKIINLSLASL